MNILILNWRDSKNPLAGGAEIVTLEHAKAWVRAGHHVTWFTSFVPPGKKDVNHVTWCPALTHAFACSSVTISAPPARGFLLSRQFKIKIFIHIYPTLIRKFNSGSYTHLCLFMLS